MLVVVILISVLFVAGPTNTDIAELVTYGTGLCNN